MLTHYLHCFSVRGMASSTGDKSTFVIVCVWNVEADSLSFSREERPKESGSPAKGQEWSGMRGTCIKCAV